MIVDFHLHMEPGQFNGMDVSAETVLKNLDDSGVDRGVVFPLARWEMEETRRANDYVAKKARESKGRLIPFCSVNPTAGEEALKELERCALKLGVRGLKLHPSSQGFAPDDSRVVEVVKRAGELGLIVLIDSYNPFDSSFSASLLKLALLECPKTTIILAHSLVTQIDELLVLSVVERYGVGRNVYCDLSALLTMYEDSPKADHISWLIKKIGPERFLFGSDFPMWTSEEALRALNKLNLGEIATKIMGENALGLLSQEDS